MDQFRHHWKKKENSIGDLNGHMLINCNYYERVYEVKNEMRNMIIDFGTLYNLVMTNTF